MKLRLSMDATTTQSTDDIYMRMALIEADKSYHTGDVPVGAVLVNNATGEVITGHNTREVLQSATGHAEINVINDACTSQESWRLSDYTLYVTLEPCPMCAGAILHARIPRVVYGAPDPVAGAMGSVWALHRHPLVTPYAGSTQVDGGYMEAECRQLLQNFFREQRKREFEI